jgi:DNA-binding transcriptional MerR regulator
MVLTFTQVCKAAGANDSTGRFYKSKFEEFFVSAGTGRHKTYDQRAVDLLIRIKELYGMDYTYEQVRRALEDSMGVQVTDLVPQDTNSSNFVVQQEFTDAIRKVFREELFRRDELIIELQEELVSVKEALLRVEQNGNTTTMALEDRDREVMESIRAVQLAVEQQRSRTWWMRLLGK